MIKLITKAIGIILNNPYKFASKHKKNIFLGNSVLSRSFRVILNGDKNNLTIGNGSVGNAQVRLKPYTYNGKEGISVQLLALQVTNLKEYIGGESLAFEAIDSDKDVI